ncbi:hypothetical protein RI543_000331 [Arxiozyma heterogenica]|uniref:Uncharacterized protein n=1 Tax=Arxiozyma heterogenica TaxID=278026 RepID=A0AAN7WPE8_9SACH|nr:hypothetical protein RI543_000331 [Kazachstania heterogenica]
MPYNHGQYGNIDGNDTNQNQELNQYDQMNYNNVQEDYYDNSQLEFNRNHFDNPNNHDIDLDSISINPDSNRYVEQEI